MPGSSKKFGVRYGRRLRLKHEAVETEQKTKYKCPYCHKHAVKRRAMGIWECPKCSAIFTGKAYSIAKKSAPEEAAEEKVLEEPIEESEENYEKEMQEQTV